MENDQNHRHMVPGLLRLGLQAHLLFQALCFRAVHIITTHSPLQVAWLGNDLIPYLNLVSLELQSCLPVVLLDFNELLETTLNDHCKALQQNVCALGCLDLVWQPLRSSNIYIYIYVYIYTYIHIYIYACVRVWLCIVCVTCVCACMYV